MVLRVGFVKEHFSSPLLQFAQIDNDRTFTLVECPSGTGQLISRLDNDEIDIAIALTDPLIAGIAKGAKFYKLVGSYVSTPLNWAVVTGKDSKYHNISDLKDTKIGISRPGSGSQTMAYVMAQQQGWPPDNLEFQVNNTIQGLMDSVNAGTTSAFMWEWFTTKPWVDSGEVRFIGSVPTPWPSWMIAAHTSPERATPGAVRSFTATLTAFVREFDSHESRAKKNVDFIKENFGYPETDIKEWMKTVKYPEDCTAIRGDVIVKTLNTLTAAGFFPRPSEGFDPVDFIDGRVVRLT